VCNYLDETNEIYIGAFQIKKFWWVRVVHLLELSYYVSLPSEFRVVMLVVISA
jgi:hypothetical protein